MVLLQEQMASALEGMITGWMEVRNQQGRGVRGEGGRGRRWEGLLEGAIRRRRAAPE